MKLLYFAATAALVVVTATTSAAQSTMPVPSAEAILYRSANYQGPAFNVNEPQPRLAGSFGSMRLVRGQMQLCSLPNFSGTCVTATASYSDLSPLGLPHNQVGSMRPVAASAPQTNVGPTLRGQAAQFYAAPARNGQRVAACPGGTSTVACARQSAEAFCRTQGYNYVGNVGRQSVGRSDFLVDVLCKRSAV